MFAQHVCDSGYRSAITSPDKHSLALNNLASLARLFSLAAVKRRMHVLVFIASIIALSQGGM
jgi:hypothetical protein